MKLALVLVAMLVAGCGFATATPDPRTAIVGCSLRQDWVDLVAQNGVPVLQTRGNLGGRSGTLTLDWPEGWTIRPTDSGQLAVLDSRGTVRVRTGTRVILSTSDYLNTYNRDGEYIVCDAYTAGT